MDLTEYERGWLAGFIDGEGSLSLLKHKDRREGHRSFFWYVLLQITSTDKASLEYVQKLVGAGSIRNRSFWKATYKPSFGYTLCRKGVHNLLLQLRMVTKERRRLLLLEATELIQARMGGNKSRHSLHNQRLEEIYQEMHYLNQRGCNIPSGDSRRMEG